MEKPSSLTEQLPSPNSFSKYDLASLGSDLGVPLSIPMPKARLCRLRSNGLHHMTQTVVSVFHFAAPAVPHAVPGLLLVSMTAPLPKNRRTVCENSPDRYPLSKKMSPSTSSQSDTTKTFDVTLIAAKTSGVANPPRAIPAPRVMTLQGYTWKLQVFQRQKTLSTEKLHPD